MAGPHTRRSSAATVRCWLAASWLLLSIIPASACTCEGEDSPANLRAAAELVVEGEVLAIEELPSRLETLSRATIRITAKPRWAKLPEVLRVDTAASSEACGYRFRRGEKREFVIRRFGTRLVTNACLMHAAKGPANPPEPAFDTQAATP